MSRATTVSVPVLILTDKGNRVFPLPRSTFLATFCIPPATGKDGTPAFRRGHLAIILSALFTDLVSSPLHFLEDLTV